MTIRSLIVDTNLLVLFVVGATSRNYISKHKRLRGYSVDDYDILCSIISAAKEVIVTPNTLTEASNLVRHIEDPIRSEICETLKVVISSTHEDYIASIKASDRKEYIRLGLTDAALLELGSRACTILTTDLDLYLAASNKGYPAINFNHYRNA